MLSIQSQIKQLNLAKATKTKKLPKFTSFFVQKTSKKK